MPDNALTFPNSPMTITQAAQHLNVSPRFVRRLIDEGRLPYLKLGRCVRLRALDLDEYMSSSLVGADR
jgi:excisionase family DNA binding protein